VLDANIEVLELASPEGETIQDPILERHPGKSILRT